jgi:DNA-directed RNA polymerase subunit RPC12/RpoP
MQYICDNCGTKQELNDMESGTQYTHCPICKGKLLSETEYKEKEEIQEALKDEGAEENPFGEPDETLRQTPEEIRINMREDLQALGNDDLWYLLEDIPDAKERLLYRKIFIEVGGKVPETTKGE